MTTVTFVFLTLFTWMVSSGTWLRLDRCTALGQYAHDEETKGFSSNASYKKAVTHDKTKLTLTCERSPEMSVAKERTFTQDRIKTYNTSFSCVNCILCHDCGHHCKVLQRVKETLNGGKQNRHVLKLQQLWVYFPSKSSCLLLTMEIKSDNHSTHFNYRGICPSFVLLRSVAHCSHIIVITHVVVDRWKAMDCMCICKASNLEVKILQSFLYKLGPAFPESLVFILSDSQESLMSSVQSVKANVRICSVQMPSKFCAPHCPTQERVEGVRPADISRWVARCFLAAVLLLGIYMTRVKISPNRVSPAHGANSTMLVIFTMTWHWFSPPVTIHQPSEWSQTAVGVSFVICLSFALGRTVHVLIICRASHTVMKLFCTTQQQFGALPVTVLFLWLISSPPFPHKNVKHWFEDILVGDTVGSTLRSGAVLGYIDLLATLYYVFVSLPSLLQCILTRLNFLSVLLNVHLITCLENSRVPAKYILVIKINRLI